MKTLVDHIIWLNLYDISYLINNICIMFEILSKEAFDKNKVQVMVGVHRYRGLEHQHIRKHPPPSLLR